MKTRFPTSATAGLTTMEVLIAAAIILVLAAIAGPVVSTLKLRAAKPVALERLKALGGAVASYASQHDGLLPAEDVEGNDSWERIGRPEAKDAWYNALPRMLGRKGAGEFGPSDFYTDENLAFLPGANYPDKKKLLAPQFAIAFNTKLQRNDPSGVKTRAKMTDIADPARTVALLEQGCLNEDRTLEVQSKSDYDGAPKGSAKSFVGRYGGQGVLQFLDGHAEFVKVSEVLTETGSFPFPQTQVVWTPKPDENPNKDAATRSAQDKKKK